MNTVRPIQNRAGVTLLELLLVIFIIAILAAVFLPVIGRTKTRSRQVDCLSQLRQVGIAHHAFAHDHNGKFPFQVPMREGGTLELIQNVGGTVQTAFQHFRALSNDLITPRVLTCPADKRTRADSFSEFRNENLSYFVSVTSDYSRPDEVLCGDRNIRLDGESSLSIMRFTSSSHVAWTGELHEYDGNLLFTDTHVERRSSAALHGALTDSSNRVVAVMPVDPASDPKPPSSGADDAPYNPFDGLKNVYGSGSGSGSGSSGSGSGGSASAGSGGGSSYGSSASGVSASTSSGSANSPSSPSGGGSRALNSRRPFEDPVYTSTGQAQSRTNKSPKYASVATSTNAAESPTAPAPLATFSVPGVSGTLVVSKDNWWWLVVLLGITLVIAFSLIAALVYRRDRRRLRPMERKLTYGLIADRRRRGRM